MGDILLKALDEGQTFTLEATNHHLGMDKELREKAEVRVKAKSYRKVFRATLPWLGY